MARTVIDIDDEALARAAKVLGAKTKVDTVNRALNAVAPKSPDADEESQRFGEFLDLVGEMLAETDVRGEAWR